MDSVKRRPINEIIDAWHSKFAEIRLSEHGTPMPIIPKGIMLEGLKTLGKTLKQHGYSYDEINTKAVSLAIADKCWKEDQIKKIPRTEVRTAKKHLTDLWDSVIHAPDFSGIVIATLDESEKIIPVEKTEYKKPQKEEKIPDLNPKDRIIVDISNMSECPIDEEIAAELAALGTVLKDDK